MFFKDNHHNTPAPPPLIRSFLPFTGQNGAILDDLAVHIIYH